MDSISSLIEAIRSLGVEARVEDGDDGIIISLPLIDVDFGRNWVILYNSEGVLAIIHSTDGVYYSRFNELVFIGDYSVEFSIRSGFMRIIIRRIR